MLTNILIGLITFLIVKIAFWPVVAWAVSRPKIFRALYLRALKTPYWDLEGYMERWWLFNPINTTYEKVGTTLEIREVKTAKHPWCPVSVRMHHILRADSGRDKHNHPGTFRTIIGLGWYQEERDEGSFLRFQGDTAVLEAGEFHHVAEVSHGGVWTIFIMWRWRDTWGFRTSDGSVVPHQLYRDGGKP